jgi:hypothetical protein
MQSILPITVYRQGPGKREGMQVYSPWLPYTHQSQVSLAPFSDRLNVSLQGP